MFRILSSTPHARARILSRATARDFIKDLSEVQGKVRFIVVGEGAILESVSKMSPVKYTDIPNKGTMATVSNEDKSFEAHVYLSKLEAANLVKGNRNVVRLLGSESKGLMSLIIDEPEAFHKLFDQYGAAVNFEPL